MDKKPWEMGLKAVEVKAPSKKPWEMGLVTAQAVPERSTAFKEGDNRATLYVRPEDPVAPPIVSPENPEPRQPEAEPKQMMPWEMNLIEAGENSVERLPEAKTYFGDEAIKKVEELEGRTMSLAERRVIEEEAYVEGVYKDDKGVSTQGVGQTGEYKDMTFKQTFDAHVKRAKRKVDTFDSLPEELQAEIIQLEYRGDLTLKSGKTAKWVKLLDEGKYADAALELLDHKEYKERKAVKDDGVTRRMEAARDVILRMVND